MCHAILFVGFLKVFLKVKNYTTQIWFLYEDFFGMKNLWIRTTVTLSQHTWEKQWKQTIDQLNQIKAYFLNVFYQCTHLNGYPLPHASKKSHWVPGIQSTNAIIQNFRLGKYFSQYQVTVETRLLHGQSNASLGSSAGCGRTWWLHYDLPWDTWYRLERETNGMIISCRVSKGPTQNCDIYTNRPTVDWDIVTDSMLNV